MSEALAASIIVNLALGILTLAKRLPLPKIEKEKEAPPVVHECPAHKGLINWLKDTRDELKANTSKIAEVAENLARLEGRMFP